MDLIPIYIKSTPNDEEPFWQAHVEALAASNLSRREYSRRHHLAYHALTYRYIKPRASSTAVSQLSLIEALLPHRQPLSLHGTAFRIYLQSGHLLEIDADFDQDALQRLLADLERQ